MCRSGAIRIPPYSIAIVESGAQALQRVDLMCSDFAQPLRLARKGDFVYIDPPIGR